MIKKYYSKYTGKQIDEAVAALIENNVKIEDLNEEVVELINSKANEGDLAALKEEVNNEFKVALEDLVGSASEPTPVPTSGMIENVYFNRSLTAEQVNEICSQLTFNIGSTCTYTLFRTAEDSVYIAGYWDSTTKSVYGFEIRTYNGAEYMNNEWQDYATNGTGIYEVNEEITYAGTQNDLLVNLVSITPFTASKGRVGELEAAVEELHNGIGELEETGLHIMTQNHVLCPYIVEDIVKLVTNQVSMTHRKMTTEEINFFTELKGNSTSKIAIPVGDTMIYAKKVSENDSADLKTMNYIVLSGTESYTMNVILRSDGGEDLNNTIDIFKYTFAEKHNIDTLETEVEELKNKSTLIRCDSVGVDLLTAYNEQSVDRNLTAEEAEVFNQFVNNENLTSLYAQVEGLADVVLTKSAYLTQDSIDIISFSAVIMDCYLDTIVCIYPEGSGVLGSIEISKRDLTMPKIAEECPYFGEEIYTLLTGNNVNDRKLTSAELDYFTNIKDKNSSLKITLKNTALQVHFYKYYTSPDRLIYRTIDENKIYSIIVYFGDDRGEEYVNTVGFDSNIFTEENEFNNLERHVDTLESTIGDIDAVLSEINGSGTTSGDSSSGGTGETILQLNSIFMDVFNAYYGDESVDRIATSEEQAFFNNLINRLNSGEKISGIYTSSTSDMNAYIYLTFESYIEGAGIYFDLSTGDLDSGIKKVTLAYSEGGNILITPTIVSSGGSSGGSSENYIQDDAIIMDILMNVGGGQTFSRPLTEDEITLFSNATFNKIKSKMSMEGQEVEISLYNSIEQVGVGGSFFAYLFEFLIYVSIDLTTNEIIYDFIDYSNKIYSCAISGISSYDSTNKKYNITAIGGNDFNLLFDGNYGTIRISLGTTEYKYVIDCYNSTEKYFYINSLGPLSNTPLKIYKNRIEIENDILSNNFNGIFIDTYKFSLVAL